MLTNSIDHFNEKHLTPSPFDIAFQNPSLPWIKSGLPSPASLKPYLVFIQFVFPQKLFLPLFMGLGDLQRKYQISFEF